MRPVGRKDRSIEVRVISVGVMAVLVLLYN